MRLVVTGGGTGGHVYPALEVARYAREQGDELLYLGSFRGQEGEAAAQAGVSFQGFHAAPLYSLKSPRGWKSAVILMRAVGTAKALLRIAKPDVVFSTGGYSAAPVIGAAKSMGIPYVLFEANSIPGRTHRIFAPKAAAFASVFHKTAERMASIKVTRTGMPIRKALRDASPSAASAEPAVTAKDKFSEQRASRSGKGQGAGLQQTSRKEQPEPDPFRFEKSPLVLVLGGSQGSAFLNEAVPKAAAQLDGVAFLHATGPKNYDVAIATTTPDNYRFVPYLEQDQMIEALASATLVVARSGGTLAEFACFQLPSVLVPLPNSADDHQLHNAREFEAMGAATVVEQTDATPERVAEAIQAWRERDTVEAIRALADWDIPDATGRIYHLIQKAKR